MKRKIILIMSFLLITLVIFTGCNNKEEVQNNSKIENIVEEENVVKPYAWVIEPKIEAEDIIDLDIRKEVSLIKKGKKYNFINNDQGKELLREDFFRICSLRKW